MNENYIIPKSDEFMKKIQKMHREGPKHLHVVMDFDYTMTLEYVDGQKQPASIGHFRTGQYFTPDYEQKANALLQHYYPLEKDLTQTLEERISHSEEWWGKHYALFLEAGLTADHVRQVIEDNSVHYRGGVLNWMRHLSELDIPMLVFSAGLGNVIESSLRSKNVLTPNVHIIANFLTFNEQGKLSHPPDHFITSLSKNETQIRNSPYFDQIKSRKNVMVLGDRLEDLHMTNGLPHETIIKIGFLNQPTPEEQKKFEEHFDVVILNNESIEPFLLWLKAMGFG